MEISFSDADDQPLAATWPMPDQESSQERSAWSARSYDGRGSPAKPSAARRSRPRWSSTLLVGSRTGAVPGWVRLQPPPPRTARTDFPYAALLPASRHGLCDLPTRSAFGRGPIADPIVSEEPEPFMEPRRTPPLPAEAAIVLSAFAVT